jgi:hypothetical protein
MLGRIIDRQIIANENQPITLARVNDETTKAAFAWVVSRHTADIIAREMGPGWQAKESSNHPGLYLIVSADGRKWVA